MFRNGVERNHVHERRFAVACGGAYLCRHERIVARAEALGRLAVNSAGHKSIDQRTLLVGEIVSTERSAQSVRR